MNSTRRFTHDCTILIYYNLYMSVCMHVCVCAVNKV